MALTSAPDVGELEARTSRSMLATGFIKNSP